MLFKTLALTFAAAAVTLLVIPADARYFKGSATCPSGINSVAFNSDMATSRNHRLLYADQELNKLYTSARMLLGWILSGFGAPDMWCYDFGQWAYSSNSY